MGADLVQVRNDVGLTIQGHAGIRSGVVPCGPLHHVGHPLGPVGLAASADRLLLWNSLLLEKIVLTHTGVLCGVAVFLVLQDRLVQCERHRFGT